MKIPCPKPVLVRVLRWLVERLHQIADNEGLAPEEALNAEAIRYTAHRLEVDADQLELRAGGRRQGRT